MKHVYHHVLNRVIIASSMHEAGHPKPVLWNNPERSGEKGGGRGSEWGVAASAAKSSQLCPTLCDPIDSSPLGYPSLGFSRQEHWSGLPFPSPMHESKK